jgi:hypothetical protein
MGGTMELTKEQLEFIRERSREIDFGRISIDIVGDPSNNITISTENRIRFHNQKALETEGNAVDNKRSGRY